MQYLVSFEVCALALIFCCCLSFALHLQEILQSDPILGLLFSSKQLALIA